MNNTIQISIKTDDAGFKDQLVARLSDAGYDAFEENENELNAYIKEDCFDAGALQNVMNDYKADFTKSIIEDQNWNTLWESNFEAVVVDDFCGVRAAFHQPFSHTEYEIIITPKMSFGTGHHATTYMMISAMRYIDFKGKQVADFGTGTGILSVLAEKMGSNYVWATDNDDRSIENAKENTEINKCKNIVVEKSEGFLPKQPFDIILANINKNVILQNADNLQQGLKNQGTLLLSGLLKTDEEDIISAFAKKGFQRISTAEKNNWICLLLSKEQNAD